MSALDKRPLAVLHIMKLRKMGDFIVKMRYISSSLADNVIFFPTPVPALTTFNTDISNLETAEEDAKSRKAGLVAIRNQKYAIVLDDVHSLLNYVQGLADLAGNEEGAITIITASGFDLKQYSARVKPEFTVRNTDVSGIVELIAKAAAKRSAYEWQMSDDRIAWTYLPATLEAKTTVAGLTPNTTKYFRYRPVLKGGLPQSWSQSVSISVV